MPWNTAIPEACDGIAGEHAAEEKPCPVGDDYSQEDVAAVASSRAVEEAEVEQEDGDFGERQALAISHHADVQRDERIVDVLSREGRFALTQGKSCFETSRNTAAY